MNTDKLGTMVTLYNCVGSAIYYYIDGNVYATTGQGHTNCPSQFDSQLVHRDGTSVINTVYCLCVLITVYFSKLQLEIMHHSPD